MSSTFSRKLFKLKIAASAFAKVSLSPIFWWDFLQTFVSVTRQKSGYAWLHLLRCNRFALFAVNFILCVNQQGLSILLKLSWAFFGILWVKHRTIGKHLCTMWRLLIHGVYRISGNWSLVCKKANCFSIWSSQKKQSIVLLYHNMTFPCNISTWRESFVTNWFDYCGGSK